MGEHSLLSPSSAERWVECPASVFRCLGYPVVTSEYAEEGTRAHALADKTLRLNHGGLPVCPSDPEMEAYITNYVKVIRKAAKNADFVWYETKLDLSDVLGVPEQFGTGDVVILKGDTLEVHDLKYGKGVRKDAKDNPQLILYGLGALKTAEMLKEVKSVKLGIHQVRLDHYSEWTYTVDELKSFGVRFKEAAQLAMSITNNAKAEEHYHPGDDACRFCPAKGECKALANHMSGFIAEDFEDLTKIPEYDAEFIATLLPHLDEVIKWANAVKEAALGRLLKGDAIPGYKLVRSKGGNRKWSNEDEVESIMKSMKLKMDEMYTKKLITPPAAEKMLKDSPRRWERLAGLIIRAEGSPTLAPESDTRETYVNDVSQDFNDLTENGKEFL